MTAVISADGRYRYRLERTLVPSGDPWRNDLTVAFIMLNPSTADAEIDDRTIGRCKEFARREGADRLIVGNLYAWRSTKPDNLFRAADPEGPDNAMHLAEIMRDADVVIAGWGADPRATKAAKAFPLYADVVSGKALHCLGVTASGAPRHPLYVKGDTPLIAWPT